MVPWNGGAILQEDYLWRQQQQQDAIRRQQEATQQQDEQFRQSVIGDRDRWLSGFLKQPGVHTEKVGGADAAIDANGRIRDLKYQSGDVNFRSFTYDQAGNVQTMIVNSKSVGAQVWNRTPDGNFVDQNGQVFQGDMKVNQDTGTFSTISYRDGVQRNYDTGGHRTTGDPGVQPGRDQRGDRGTRGGQEESEPGFDQAMKETYGPTERDKVDHRITDRQNYRENLWGSAEGRRPVVMTFYRGSDAENSQVVDAMNRAKQASGGKADFMAVDLDKVDPQSPIGQYARDYIGRQYGSPMTLVFTQRQGEGNTPVVPETPLHWQRGAVDVNRLNDAVQQAVAIQQQRDIKVDRSKINDGRDNNTDKPPVPTKPVPTPQELLNAMTSHPYDTKAIRGMLSEVKAPKTERNPATGQLEAVKDPRTGKEVMVESIPRQTELLQQAIKLADDQLKNTNPADAAAVQAAKERAASARAAYGLVLVDVAAGYAERKEQDPKAAKEDNEAAHLSFTRGMEYLMDAGARNPNLYQQRDFLKAVLASKLPGQSSELLLESGMKDPLWFKKENADDQRYEYPQEAAYRRHLAELMRAMFVPRQPLEQRNPPSNQRPELQQQNQGQPGRRPQRVSA